MSKLNYDCSINHVYQAESNQLLLFIYHLFCSCFRIFSFCRKWNIIFNNFLTNSAYSFVTRPTIIYIKIAIYCHILITQSKQTQIVQRSSAGTSYLTNRSLVTVNRTNAHTSKAENSNGSSS